ncbi:MAG: biopolymer transporter ExbD [Ectothiorhodospiraceae bacterium]|nr:biopolymer transporter ExbD [Ectothiorhodospiraceae bacterium]
MNESRRSQRMSRHHGRTKRNASLNMVSLMDIFTILVFFLLVSSSSVKDLPNAKQIQLPESSSQQLPKETVVIIVGEKDIVVQGRKIASVPAVMGSKSIEIRSLKIELVRLAKRTVRKTTPDGKPVPREVTIMGDKKIPFALLKKIMLTCTKAEYTNISLAVLRKRDKG